MIIRCLAVLLLSTAAQAQSPVEQILQNTIAVCVGDNARAVVQLQETQRELAGLRAKLSSDKEKSDAKQVPEAGQTDGSRSPQPQVR